ncbi:hypothetical protein EDD21DRAFT_379033 [Dissophora ornata]|nr:hypothetical protein EDD21DRAFT_379033 [Dissophora ornata]
MAGKPTVMIVGAGLGGVMLAILLERLNVPYTIFEKASTVKPLGSVMGFGGGTLTVLDQLGLLDKVMKFAHPTIGMQIYGEDMTLIGDFDTRSFKDICGYNAILFARSELYDLLLSQVPPKKVLFKKKIISMEQSHHGVTIQLQDGSNHHGDILVGADGAYSTVRQSLYAQVDKKGLLPESDKEHLSTGHLCVVAMSGPLDPEKYPTVTDSVSHFQRMISVGSNHSWSTANVSGNRIAWTLVTQIETMSESKDVLSRASEWGSDGNDGMLLEYRDYRAPIGGTMGDLMDVTPKEHMSKIFFEEKLFETWHHGRTVLIGDACHKILPSSGQGAQNAIQDAVVLANCINDLVDLSPESIETAFAEYKEQRYSIVSHQIQRSRIMAKVIYGHTWHERALRYIVFNLLPKSTKDSQLHRDLSYRPQANFLPLVENKGTGFVQQQWVSRRKREKQ